MRPPTIDTSRPPLERARSVVMTAAVGLALVFGGTAPAQAGQTLTGAGGTAAAPAAAGQAAVKAATVRSGRLADARLGRASRPVSAHVTARRRPTGGTHLDINLSSQSATLYKGGKRVVRFHVSTGKRGWRTPTGNYRIYRKLSGWHRSRLGLMWRPAYFRGGYAIHGSRSVPSYPASHGCVRVAMGRMAWLSPRLPIGTTVRLHY